MITDDILLNANYTVGSNNLYAENRHFLCGGGNQLNGIAGRAYLCALAICLDSQWFSLVDLGNMPKM